MDGETGGNMKCELAWGQRQFLLKEKIAASPCARAGLPTPVITNMSNVDEEKTENLNLTFN